MTTSTYLSFIEALRRSRGLQPLGRAQSDNNGGDDNDGLETVNDAGEYITRAYRRARGEDDDDNGNDEAKAKVRQRRIADGQPLRANATTQEVAAFITEHYRRARFGDQP
jgi:hypothetical protein